MEINFKTINESIRDISFIEKSSQEFDLESSIAQCIFDINFPNAPKKPELKKSKTQKILIKKNDNIKKSRNRISNIKYNNSTKDSKKTLSTLSFKEQKIENIKNKILKIFEENDDNLKKIQEKQKEKDQKLEEYLIENNKNFFDEIDKLYVEKINKINEINEKYNLDLFELKDFVKDEMNGNNRYKSNLKQIFDSVNEDKINELNKLNEDFYLKKNILIQKYKIIINKQNKNENDILVKNQMFENLKKKIMKVINS